MTYRNPITARGVNRPDMAGAYRCHLCHCEWGTWVNDANGRLTTTTAKVADAAREHLHDFHGFRQCIGCGLLIDMDATRLRNPLHPQCRDKASARLWSDITRITQEYTRR